MNNHFLKYPYVNEKGDGCCAIVKKIGLYVQCNKKCVNETQYCNICSFSFNKICISDRVVGGFKNNKPALFDKMQCYKKTLKKHGLTITKIKKQAAKLGLTLNMDYINEISNEKINTRVKDVSVVMDTSDEDEAPQPVKRPRGRPKKINVMTNDDLIRNMTSNHSQHVCEDSDSEPEYEYDSDEEILVEPFSYTGDNEKYKNVKMFKSDQDSLYTEDGELIGMYCEHMKMCCFIE